jgi:glutathione S-transferase
MAALRLHDYPASANCFKVRLLLAQLGRAYERVEVDIFAGDTLTDAYARINPFRSTPVLEVAPGRHVIESNAILAYLAEGTPFLPADRLERAEATRWLIQEQTDVMPAIGGLRFRLVTGRLASDDPEALRRREAGEEILDILAAHLGERRFLIGDAYSIADIAVHAYVHVAGDAGFDLRRWPPVEHWLARVAATPGYVDDLAPYPPNARPGAGRSIYD